MPGPVGLDACLMLEVDEFLRFESSHQRGNRRLLAFGIHCAGLGLARLEGRIAIGRFPQRFPDYRLRK